ncbi:isoprenylcysteine carboxylmethyltransferase family protein [candidate division KSB1 bacterium]|nr:isoprenylcysteine carboxylmethyltransferase family protein [candidate division KSB1 bacterium]
MHLNFGIIFLTISALWFFSEIMLNVLRRSKNADENRDKGSLRLLNIVIYTCVALAVTVNIMGIGRIATTNATIPWIGVAVIICGLILRWTAILTLRRYFTTNVVIQRDHQIIRTGLYRYIRHPSYSGALLSFWGLGLAFCNWISIIVLIVPITFAFLKRIQLEEQALLTAFGEQYSSYRKTTRALIPWIY